MYWTTISLFIISCANRVCGSNCLTDPSGTNLLCDCCKPGFGGFNCTQPCSRCESRLIRGTICHKSCKGAYYGALCNTQCSQYCTKGVTGEIVCQKKDGECFNGCVPGRFGLQCDLVCKSECLNNECLQKDGSCNRCKENLYYGKHCTVNCSKGCLNGTCEMDGICIHGCENGYYGDTCSQQCGAHCLNHSCIANTSGGFHCVDGCTDGYTSISCTDRCPEHCVKCEQDTGRCTSCEFNYDLTCDNGDCNNGLVTCQRQDGFPTWAAAIITVIVIGIGIGIVIGVAIIVYLKRKRGHSDNKEDPEVPLLHTNGNGEAVHTYEDGNDKTEKRSSTGAVLSDQERASRQRLINTIHDRTKSKIEVRTKSIVKTSSAEDIVKKIFNGLTWITITGRPGEGKSTFAYSVLKELQRRGRNVFEVINTEEFKSIISAYKRPIILLNKIFSDVVNGQAECGNWKKILSVYWDKKGHRPDEQEYDRPSGATVVLVEHDYFLSSSFYYHGKLAEFITQRSLVFDVSKTLKLSEKTNICTAVANRHAIQLHQSEIRTLCQQEVSAYQVLQLFTILHKNNPEVSIHQFITSPQMLFQDEIKRVMKDELTSSLFQEIVRQDGKVSDELFKNMHQSSKISKIANDLVGAYLSKEKDFYTFINLSVYNIVEYMVCSTFPQFVINMCELSVIKRRLFLQHSDSCRIQGSDNIVCIDRKDSTALAERFAKELIEGNLYLVLSHDACTCEWFIEKMVKKCCLTMAEILMLTDKHSKEEFLSLVTSSKSPNLLKYIEQREHILKSESNVKAILYGVCKYGATDAFVFLQEKCNLNFDIIADKDKGRTPIMIATETEDTTIVDLIMARSPDLAICDNNGATVLHYLSVNGLHSATREAINQGAIIDTKDKFGLSPLHYAAKFDEMEIGRLLLHKGATFDAKIIDAACRKWETDVVKLFFKSESVNMEVGHGYTPLHSACAGGNIGVINFLIEQGASVNSHGRSPLHIAASHSEPAVVKCLLKKGANVKSKDTLEETPFHYAAAAGSRKCLELLLDAGVSGATLSDINGKSCKGLTPLHKAAKARSKECIDILLNAGATVNVKSEDDSTPLHIASSKGDEECVQTLIDASASVNVANKDGYSPLHEAAKWGFSRCLNALLKNGADVTVRNKHEQTPLHKAAETGSHTCVLLLIQHNAEVNAKTKSGKTPLHFATESTSLECIHALLKAGADKNVQDDLGFIPFHLAAKAGSERCINALLDTEINVNIQTEDGETPLHLSAETASAACVDLLLKKGANVNTKNKKGATALHKAVALVCDTCSTRFQDKHLQGAYKPFVKALGSNVLSCVDVLINAKADVNIQNFDGQTPLYLAAEYDLCECLSTLLECQPNVNMQNKRGDTPLHKAVESRCKQCVSSLLESGADRSIVNKSGFTPRDIALQTGNTEIESMTEESES